MNNSEIVVTFDNKDLLAFYTAYVKVLECANKLYLYEVDIKTLSCFYYLYNYYKGLGLQEEDIHILILSVKNLKSICTKYSYSLKVLYNTITRLRRITINGESLVVNRTINTKYIPIVGSNIPYIKISHGIN